MSSLFLRIPRRFYGLAHLPLGPKLVPVKAVGRPVGSPDWSMGHRGPHGACVHGGLAVVGPP
jgi:hypothetical protein